MTTNYYINNLKLYLNKIYNYFHHHHRKIKLEGRWRLFVIALLCFAGVAEPLSMLHHLFIYYYEVEYAFYSKYY